MNLLFAGAAPAQTMPGPATSDGAPTQEGGWDGLAQLLDALKPGVDTTLAPTASEITERIETLLNSGQARQALDLIQARIDADHARHTPGRDVQLLFLHARALAATGDAAGAERLYQELTRSYPELPEPWNNLAALHMQRDQLDLAQQALQTAILIDPKYGVAHANLAELQLMRARQSFQRAAELGVAGAQRRANETHQLLERP